MKELKILLKKEFWEQTRKRYTFIFLAFFPLFTSVQLAYIAKQLGPPTRNAVAPLLVNTLFSHYALSVFWVVSFMFLQSAVTKEKLTKSIEILLVTPLSPWKIWLGKSLFIWGWGICSCILLVSVGLIGLNTVIDKPGGVLLPSVPPTLFFFVVLPFLSFFVVALNAILQLLSFHPVLLNFIYFQMGFLYFFIASAKTRSVSFSWMVLLFYIAITLVLGALLLFLSKHLTRERIILGAK